MLIRNKDPNFYVVYESLFISNGEKCKSYTCKSEYNAEINIILAASYTYLFISLYRYYSIFTKDQQNGMVKIIK